MKKALLFLLLLLFTYNIIYSEDIKPKEINVGKEKYEEMDNAARSFFLDIAVGSFFGFGNGSATISPYFNIGFDYFMPNVDNLWLGADIKIIVDKILYTVSPYAYSNTTIYQSYVPAIGVNIGYHLLGNKSTDTKLFIETQPFILYANNNIGYGFSFLAGLEWKMNFPALVKIGTTISSLYTDSFVLTFEFGVRL